MARLKEVLRHKNKGDEWFSYLAPEEYHIWQKKTPWDFNTFRKYGVSLLSVSVSASEDVPGTKNVKKFSRKEPFYLENTGVEIFEGLMGTKVRRVGSGKFRVDSVIELNEILKEFSIKTNIETWWISTLEISNKKSGGICQFQRHNPDGHGVSLYFYRLTLDSSSILYPDVSKIDQEFYAGNFRQYLAKCVCHEKKQKFHGCELDKKVHRIIK